MVFLLKHKKAYTAKYYSVNEGSEISINSTSDVLVPGMTITPGAGTYTVSYNSQYSIIPNQNIKDFSTEQGSINLVAIYNNINSVPATQTAHAAAYGSGETLFPGVYAQAAALSIAGKLTLDGQNNPNSLFIFKANGAINTGAGTVINLINGASASHIFWVEEGAIGLGASTIMKGTLIAHDAALAVGADCKLEGRIFSTAGAIAFGPGTATIPIDKSYFNLGVLSNFVIFTSSGGISNTGNSTYTGDIATGLGAITAFEAAVINGTIFLSGTTPVTDNDNAVANFSIYQDGVLVSNSGRSRSSTINTVDIVLQGVAKISDKQSIEIRCNIDQGILKLNNRILTLIQIQ